MPIDIKIKKILFGNNVSHANNKTRRKFKANSHKQKIFIEELNRYITVKAPISIIRSIEKSKLKVCEL